MGSKIENAQDTDHHRLIEQLIIPNSPASPALMFTMFEQQTFRLFGLHNLPENFKVVPSARLEHGKGNHKIKKLLRCVDIVKKEVTLVRFTLNVASP